MRKFLQIHFPLALALAGSLVAVPVTNAYGQRATPAKRHAAHRRRSSASLRRLLSDRYYTNSSGRRVHSPTRTSDGGAPAGATAECWDGTYSFSMSHRGTCSHHGGVKRWL